MKEKRGDNDALGVFLLNKMLECNVECSGNFKTRKFFYKEDWIEWLSKTLPVLPYVRDQIVNFIFSNDLTTGDPAQDEKLNKFLFAKNIKGVTNLSVLKEACKEALVYGKCGLRRLSYEDGLINVKSKNYASLMDENTEYYGFEDTVGYIVAMEDQKIWEADLDELDFDREEFERRGIIVDRDKKIIILSKEEMLNLRFDTSKEDGESPLMSEQARLTLISTAYERLNYDLEYDGPGRLILPLSGEYASGNAGESSTSEIIDQTKGAKDTRVAKAKKEVKKIAEEIKESGSDSVIALSRAFDPKDIVHLERVTKATEFFDYIDGEGEIICQVFGIQPSLVELGDVSGNVSMEKIIDNAMVNTIIPYREKFATQISGLLAEWLGVEKIYFDKYEMQQAVDENDKRTKVVNMIYRLKLSGYDWLADKFAQMLSNDLDDSGGKLKKLKSYFEDKFKKVLSVFKRDD